MTARARRRPASGSAQVPGRRARMAAHLHPSGASIARRVLLPSASPARRGLLAVDIVVWAVRRSIRMIRRQPETVATERLRSGQAVHIDTFRSVRRRTGR